MQKGDAKRDRRKILMQKVS